MNIFFDIILLIWFVVITRVTYRLSVKTQENNSAIKKIDSRVNGLKLALKVLSVRHKDPD